MGLKASAGGRIRDRNNLRGGEKVSETSGKRYYWLKLQDDFFNSKRVKKLRKIAGGDTYTIIYLKMQLLAMKKSGILEYTGLEPTFADELALDLDEEPENVSITVNYLLSCGLLETNDSKEYFVPYAVLNTGSEGASAKRVREHRERKTLQCNTDVTPVKQIGNGEKEKEKESELEKKKELKRENTRTLFQRLVPEYAFSDDLKSKMAEWITYKTERKEPYKEQGMKTLLRQVENNALTYGDQAVCNLIDDSMANGWKGIIFDRLQNQKQANQSGYTETIKNRVSKVDDW